MKYIALSAASILFFVTSTVNAQYENYAALFGRQTSFGGTARYASIGGAATSLGGDLGAATVNPAGLGMYRKSEFSFSPFFGGSGSSSNFLDETSHDSKGSFGLSSLGIAICGIKDDLDKSDWRGGTFSIGMSRTNSFHNSVSFSGTDLNNSIADYFVQAANGSIIDNLSTLPFLAYNTYVLDTTSSGNQYTNHLDDSGTGGFGSMRKEGTYTTKGGQYQWNIAYGTNYKDKLFIGGGFGITSLSFREDLTYTEIHNYNGVSNAFDVLTLNDYNKIKGTGVNFKLGYIYKIGQVLRIGTTVTTPTYYWMNQEYGSDLTAVFPSDLSVDGELLGTRSLSSDPGYFKFNYTTPAKIAIGTSLFAGKVGFLSADVEYVPYSLSTLSSTNNADDKTMRFYNDIVRNNYQNVLNLKLGGELRLDIFKFRAGLAYLPNPYKNSDAINAKFVPQVRNASPNGDITQISGGVGVKLNDFYVDLGIVNAKYKSTYQPYSLVSDPTISSFDTAAKADSKSSTVNVILTLGFYFE